jgi:hypothetical protein
VLWLGILTSRRSYSIIPARLFIDPLIAHHHSFLTKLKQPTGDQAVILIG